MTGGDRGLQRIRSQRTPEHLGTLNRRETTTDQQLIPACTVLIEEQDGLSRRADPGAQAGRLDFHQPDEAVDLRLRRHELGQDSAETQRLLAERRTHPVVTGGR